MDQGEQRLIACEYSTKAAARPPCTAPVLVVDDERWVALVVAAVVEALGYPVQVATHGRDALDLARVAWPSLVITNLMMPRLNGAGLIAALRDEAARHGHSRVPVILLTAAAMESARRAGADAVLRKPFDLDELERLIARFLLSSHLPK